MGGCGEIGTRLGACLGVLGLQTTQSAHYVLSTFRTGLCVVQPLVYALAMEAVTTWKVAQLVSYLVFRFEAKKLNSSTS